MFVLVRMFNLAASYYIIKIYQIMPATLSNEIIHQTAVERRRG